MQKIAAMPTGYDIALQRWESVRRQASAVRHADSGAALCDVCAAKRTGARVPKRKCTCSSGATVTHNRIPRVAQGWTARLEERACRQEHVDDIMFGFDCDSRLGSMSFDSEWTELQALASKTLFTDDHGILFQGFFEVCRAGNVSLLKAIGARGCNDSRCDWQKFWREAVVHACQAGQREVLCYLLDVSGVSLSDLCPYTERIVIDDNVPNPAPPLWIAAVSGQHELVSFLARQRADPNQAAFDQTTPFYMACMEADMAMVRLLHGLGVDMCAVDQDGSAPVHVAAAHGHLAVIQFLQQHGVSMESRGTVYFGDDYNEAVINFTPLRSIPFAKGLWHFAGPRENTNLG